MTDSLTGAEAFRVLQDRLLGQEPAGTGSSHLGEPAFRRLYEPSEPQATTRPAPGPRRLDPSRVALLGDEHGYRSAARGAINAAGRPARRLPPTLGDGVHGYGVQLLLPFTPLEPRMAARRAGAGIDTSRCCRRTSPRRPLCWADPFFTAALGYCRLSVSGAACGDPGSR